ncbi:hypothetical protein BX600DRAFT_472443 [Xylariales sp. PMI_506]|nr:hypothetical protein BX600DRAFT_472443 [Xylariales sp. PMI_506]
MNGLAADQSAKSFCANFREFRKVYFSDLTHRHTTRQNGLSHLPIGLHSILLHIFLPLLWRIHAFLGLPFLIVNVVLVYIYTFRGVYSFPHLHARRRLFIS